MKPGTEVLVTSKGGALIEEPGIVMGEPEKFKFTDKETKEETATLYYPVKLVDGKTVSFTEGELRCL